MNTRARLTVAAGVVTAVVVCVAAGLLVWVFQRSLLGSVDSTAKERATEAARVPVSDGVLPTSAEADNVVQIVDATGVVVASTPNVVGEGRLFTFAATDEGQVRSIKHVNVPDPADSYRVAAVPAGDGRIVYAAVPDDDAREAVRRLVIAESIGVPVLVAVLTVVLWWLVGRALRPVEVAARKQREFVADAAHELRSPLASLRAQLEVAAAGPELIAEVDRLAALTENLLQLARLESGLTMRHVVDLDDIVFGEVTRARHTASVTFDVADVSAAQVTGDPVGLGRLVRNLLDNASRHAHRRVDVSLSTDGDVAVLTVADDGPGIGVSDRERVFERFTRLEHARDRSTGGAGLGLAIVREVASAHGGSVELVNGQVGAVFVVRLPLAPAVTATRRPVAQPGARPTR